MDYLSCIFLQATCNLPATYLQLQFTNENPPSNAGKCRRVFQVRRTTRAGFVMASRRFSAAFTSGVNDCLSTPSRSAIRPTPSG
ncbi:MAG: hypothetical protein ABIR56_06205, partial [Polaromonas sp.]